MNAKKLSSSQKFFRSLLRIFPFDFQTNYGPQMEGVFHDQHREIEDGGSSLDFLKLWGETIVGIFRTAPREHWEILKQDSAYAFRMMRKNPGFTALAVLTLALGIGANTAIFSVVHAVLLRPLPYPDGQQLVFIRQQAQKVGVDDIQFSVPEIQDYRAQNKTLSGLAEYHGMSFTLFGHGDPDRVRTGVVSANYFDMFGIQPLLGRTFLPSDDVIGAPPVLVLSYEYWKQRFAGDPAIVGKTFEMNDKVHTVVGVLPPVPQYPNENDVYMPTSACPFRSSKAMIEGREHRMMEVFGRLKPDVSLAAAQADVSIIAGRLEATYPDKYPARFGYAAAASSLKSELTHEARPVLLVLLAAAAFVLLIACANVANLTLSRMARRERELAVRSALGAGRSRLLRQLLTESFMMAFVGGVLGLLIAYGSLQLLTEFATKLTPRAREIRIDSGVLLFALVAALGTSILFGTISALFSRANLSSGLKEGSAGAGAGYQRNRLRSVLIVAQIAFSFVLLIGAGLMMRSLYKMQQVDPGFVSQRALAMQLTFNWTRYAKGEQYAEVTRKILDLVRPEPGVLSAAMSSTYPLEPDLILGGANTGDFEIEGRNLQPGEASPVANITSVSPDYFKTLGIRFLEGRDFNAADKKDSLPVVIINQTIKLHLWPNEDPIGKHVSFDQGKNWNTIVGVVGDVREFGLDRPAAAEVYGPMDQNPNPGTLIVRTAMDPTGISKRLHDLIREQDSQTAITQEMTLDQARRDSMTSPRLTASLLGIFAGLALLIASAGIGGIMALMVSQRIHEIGIRMTLGAQPWKILGMILAQGMTLACLGVGIGIAGSLALTGLVKSLLFEVTPTDPITFVAVALVLIASAAIASYIPARRAAAVDPIVALRCE